MKIKVINPNTTLSMTRKIGEAAMAVARPGTEILAVSPAMGPVSIEGHYDEAISAIGVLDEVRKGDSEGCAGYVIACFDDPGLRAAREIAKGPVVGIAEAAMRMACFISGGFSVVATQHRSRIILEHLVRSYGMDHACRSVRTTELAVLDLESGRADAYSIILAECRKAIAEDHADCIVLGCAGMADLVDPLVQELGVPVIDGVACGVKAVESLLDLGLSTSRGGGYDFPVAKDYVGHFRDFSF
ncbi:aspartate/glutamate racemase family protein [Bosea sp. (in: a-proteobacteria)]|uniref:aspartate/glutamate racemase family protein n=1 Tax=Bosea sp. (in: a-proteobacteria) TaxID=1871050 RepID=UPI001AD5DD11|nr:aspartate/glutamate racemase family protein [Bosea sp. (in: a-proteobacteria)]MBN9440658.1 aspartate/glutamate racemase family protein [Bosea sp. (in: a-proteobacteria)]